jgi:hypothetical protein
MAGIVATGSDLAKVLLLDHFPLRLDSEHQMSLECLVQDHRPEAYLSLWVNGRIRTAQVKSKSA